MEYYTPPPMDLDRHEKTKLLKSRKRSWVSGTEVVGAIEGSSIVRLNQSMCEDTASDSRHRSNARNNARAYHKERRYNADMKTLLNPTDEDNNLTDPMNYARRHRGVREGGEDEGKQGV